jgi:hypothetical protein
MIQPSNPNWLEETHQLQMDKHHGNVIYSRGVSHRKYDKLCDQPVFTHEMYLYDKFREFINDTGKGNCSLTYSENHEFINEFRQWLKDYEDQQQHEEEENRKLYLKLKSEAESANMDFWAYVENQKFNQL